MLCPSVGLSTALSFTQFFEKREFKHFTAIGRVSRGVWELKREGGLLPILSPTKLTVRQNSFLSAFLSARLCARLPVFQPFYLPWGLSCLPIFFLFPSFPSFFLEIYSPTPFTVRRQGGLLDHPDPPCQTPLGAWKFPSEEGVNTNKTCSCIMSYEV